MSRPSGPSRFPRRVFEEGVEPDPRFTLANERTFLAWVRTGLALLAGGVALGVLAPPGPGGLRFVASVALIVLGVLAPVQGWFSWVRDERAMRRGEPLTAPLSMSPLAGGVLVVGLLLLAALVVGG
jgi:putative membrane protein